MSKHTPGPWKQLTFNNHELQTSFAMVQIGGYVHMIGHLNEDFANARLIAAAPDLLAICQRLLEAVPYVSEYDVPLGLWEDLQAAVNKATGETE